MARIGRTRRDGPTKLSGPPLLVLMSLAEGPKHGHALLGDIEGFAGERLGAGTLYGAIGRLEQRGLIAPLPEHGRRRPYEITPAGAIVLAEAVAELERVAAVGRRRLGGSTTALGGTA